MKHLSKMNASFKQEQNLFTCWTIALPFFLQLHEGCSHLVALLSTQRVDTVTIMHVPSYSLLQHLWCRLLLWGLGDRRDPALNSQPELISGHSCLYCLLPFWRCTGGAFLLLCIKDLYDRHSSAGAFDGLWWRITFINVMKEQQSTSLHSWCSVSLKGEEGTSWSTLCMCPWSFLLHLLTKPRFSTVSNTELLQSERMSCVLFWCMRHQQNCQLCLSHCTFIIGDFRHAAEFAEFVDTQIVFLLVHWANLA